MLLFLLKLLDFDVAFGLTFSLKAALITLFIFAAIFLLILLNTRMGQSGDAPVPADNSVSAPVKPAPPVAQPPLPVTPGTPADGEKLAAAGVKPSPAAVERGFASVSSGVPPKPYAYGVPMIPMPRSEAWLLCHYREPRYRNGPAYERLPGNDSSPKSAKKLLARCLGCRVNEIYCHVDGEEIDWMRVDAPSFDFFRRRYRHVLEKLTGQSTTLTEPETLMSEAP